MILDICPLFINGSQKNMPLDFTKKIDEVEEISIADFQEKYFKPQIPVKIKNFLKDSPAFNKWDIEFFKNTMGDTKVGVFDNGENVLDRPNNIATEQMSLSGYLDLITAGPTNKRLFLFDLLKANKALKKDIIFPKHVKKAIPFTLFAFFGGKGAYTRLHRDADNSNVFLTEFYGEKRVVLFNPAYDNLLYRYPYTVHSGIDIDNPDYEKHPGLNFVKGEHTYLKKGETLFIPAKYWHYITYLSPGIGFSFRSLGGFWNTFSGLFHVAIVYHFDMLMRKMFGKKWFGFKTKKALKRANKEIAKIKV